MEKKQPIRKNIRLPDYDYSEPGFYFVTICTAVRNRNVLCSIHTVGDAAFGVPQIRLTLAGTVVEKYIRNIDPVYSGAARVDEYAVMPDHVHLLIELCLQEDGSPRAATPTDIPRIVNTLKSLSSKSAGRQLWQRGYFDHIIRNDADLVETRQYIRNNPLNWILNKE